MSDTIPQPPLLAVRAHLLDAGLLIHRLVFGGFMVIGHGLPKLQMFGGDPSKFPDPLGIGNTLSFYGCMAGEVLGPLLIAFGLLTRVAAVPAIFTMGVAAFLIHASDPFFMAGAGAKEPALIYLVAFLTIALSGPGRFSIDHFLFRSFLRRPLD
jgi:putative oxidoreductase